MKDVLAHERADYGKETVIMIAADLVQRFGKSFQEKMCVE